MVTKKDLRSAYLKCLKDLSSDTDMVGTKESAGINNHADGSKTQVFVEVRVVA